MQTWAHQPTSWTRKIPETPGYTQASLQPTNTKLYAFAQKEPVPLPGRFDAEIESVTTGKKSVTQFLVVKGTTMSRPLLSLDTSVELGLLQLANTTYPEVQPPTESSVISNQETLLLKFFKA